ncbi:MAG: methyltransferase domain-containing protein [Rhodobacteraceae bacterium]|nr:MAG: methyltransferase domain-containing protein [Paracoccaceae bacterium]
MAEQGTAARRAALALLDATLGEGRLIAESLGAGLLDALDPPDRARAQRLALETLRHLDTADRLLKRHLRKRPALAVENALRLGTVELGLGAAAHGVVSDLVTQVGRSRRHGNLKGLVNAVLRKMAEEAPAEFARMRAPRLPNWLRRPLRDAWGAEAVAAMEAAHLRGAPLDLTLKDAADPIGDALGQRLPTGSIRVQGAGAVSALPGFSEGRWWVQDAAAALPVRVLAPREGERILDLCAAPGGKTMQLAAAGAQVVAVDVSEARMRRVTENLARTGLKAECRVEDALAQTGLYDAILLDAPCSATGTIRRHPDLPHAKDGSDFGALIDLQAAMIDHAWGLLRPGGRMVFCTCSVLPDEGEVQVAEALARHPDARLDPADLDRPGIDPAWIDDQGGLRILPSFWADRGGLDGFYIACLHKTA